VVSRSRSCSHYRDLYCAGREEMKKHHGVSRTGSSSWSNPAVLGSQICNRLEENLSETALIRLAPKAVGDMEVTRGGCLVELGLGTTDRFSAGCLLLRRILLGLVWFLPLR
jgi:succinate dehydrogenase/fumarate reductase flavoprotein subunit